MVKCPICRYNFEAKPIKSWKFGIWKVERYKCTKCRNYFNIYKGKGKTWTIPKPKK